MKIIKVLLASFGLALASQTFAAESITAKTNRLEKEVNDLKKILYSHKRGWSAPVLSSPYIGLRSAFDGSDLITNLPSINEDMRLLQQKQAFHLAYQKHQLKIPEQPIIELSGKIGGIGYASDPLQGDSSKGVDLTTSELDITAHASQWLTGFMAFSYDSSPTFLNRNRAANSRLFLDKGFITVGNLNVTPYYASLGQMFVPFGRYSSGMVSASLPKMLGRTRVRAVNFGFRHPMGYFAQAFGYNGNMDTHELNYGLNAGFEGQLASGIQVQMAAGMISDIADSDGMQNNGNPLIRLDNPVNFTGFGHHSETGVSKLEHAVPAGNLHARVKVGDWGFIGEYVFATRKFDALDMVINNHGARPEAYQFEAVYNFDFMNKPSHLALSYQGAEDTLALNIPETRYGATFSTSIWRNTMQAIEFRHDKMYDRNDTAFGRAFGPSVVTAFGRATPLLPANLTGVAGRVSNLVVLSMGLYF